jgi:hypothetical protein
MDETVRTSIAAAEQHYRAGDDAGAMALLAAQAQTADTLRLRTLLLQVERDL